MSIQPARFGSGGVNVHLRVKLTSGPRVSVPPTVSLSSLMCVDNRRAGSDGENPHIPRLGLGSGIDYVDGPTGCNSPV